MIKLHYSVHAPSTVQSFGLVEYLNKVPQITSPMGTTPGASICTFFFFECALYIVYEGDIDRSI